jgi:hypothetical protein
VTIDDEREGYPYPNLHRPDPYQHRELHELQDTLSRLRFAAFGADDAEAIDRVRQIIRELDQRSREPGGST